RDGPSEVDWSRAAVQDGMLRMDDWRSPRDLTDPVQTRCAVERLESCPGSSLGVWGLIQRTRDPNLLVPYGARLLQAARLHELAGWTQDDHTESVIQLVRKRYGASPTELAGGLGAVLRGAVNPSSLSSALQLAGNQVGASWALERLHERSRDLPAPVTGLEPSWHWTPSRRDAEILVGLLQVPRNYSVLVPGAYQQQLGSAARLLWELSRTHPHLLDGWRVEGRDFREALLQRILDDQPQDRLRAGRLLAAAHPVRAHGLSEQEALAALMFETSGGSARADQALDRLEAGLLPGAPLGETGSRLCSLLTLARLEDAREDRFERIMAGWEQRSGGDLLADPSLQAFGRKQMFRSLCRMTPAESLLARDTVRQEGARLGMLPEQVDGLLLCSWARSVSRDPDLDFPAAVGALVGAAGRLFEPFQAGLQQGNLAAMLRSLEASCQHLGRSDALWVFEQTGQSGHPDEVRHMAGIFGEIRALAPDSDRARTAMTACLRLRPELEPRRAAALLEQLVLVGTGWTGRGLDQAVFLLQQLAMGDPGEVVEARVRRFLQAADDRPEVLDNVHRFLESDADTPRPR
ncbi:MAG: hypothetical protein AB1758_13270, partial [Candidatus Eremiobacterota bacterium]